MTIACYERSQIPYYLLSAEVAVCAVVTLAAAFFLLASYQILPACVNAISHLGLFGKFLGYGALGSGLFIIGFIGIKGRQKIRPTFSTYHSPTKASRGFKTRDISKDDASKNVLPDAIVLEIFSYLKTKELCLVSSVCRQWNRLSKTDLFWQKRIEEDFDLHLFDFSQIKVDIAETTAQKEYIYFSDDHFKHILATHIFDHGAAVIDTAMLKDESGTIYLISTAEDGTVDTWDLQANCFVSQTAYPLLLNEHEQMSTFYKPHNFLSESKTLLNYNQILATRMPGNKLIALSNWENLCITNNHTIVRYFKNPNQCEIRRVLLLGNTLITGDSRGNIGFWNFHTGHYFNEFVFGHKSPITSLDYRFNRLVCATAVGHIGVITFSPEYLTKY